MLELVKKNLINEVAKPEVVRVMGHSLEMAYCGIFGCWTWERMCSSSTSWNSVDVGTIFFLSFSFFFV